jgi:hypothetical protein
MSVRSTKPFNNLLLANSLTIPTEPTPTVVATTDAWAAAAPLILIGAPAVAPVVDSTALDHRRVLRPFGTRQNPDNATRGRSSGRDAGALPLPA